MVIKCQYIQVNACQYTSYGTFDIPPEYLPTSYTESEQQTRSPHYHKDKQVLEKVQHCLQDCFLNWDTCYHSLDYGH